jgi:hypothetical protein
MQNSPLNTELHSRTIAIRSFEEFAAWHSQSRGLLNFRAQEEAQAAKSRPVFALDGYCAVCSRETIFVTDYQYSFKDAQGHDTPNWRERLECWHCRLNCRMRGALQFLGEEMQAESGSTIYITEQITPMYTALKARYPRSVGSEFLSPNMISGQIREDGVRHEDVTNLSFDGNVFNYVLSFDVLEHVPQYKKALSELHRVLVPGGELLLTVPFYLGSPETKTLAAVEGGVVKHFAEPEYHGDPLTGSVLCFYHFGWTFLDDLRTAGFSDAAVHLYWSKQFGYLGGIPFLIRATR